MKFYIATAHLGLGLVMFFLILEGGSYLGLKASKNLNNETFLTTYKKTSESSKGVLNNTYDTGYSAIRPHPYFGYVRTDGNNRGFSNQEDFPYIKKKNDYIIGIFGGSVAESLGGSDAVPILIKELKRNVSALKNKNIKVFNMALSSQKQPQAFFISSFYSSMFDLTINLDGWNEVQPRTTHGLPGRYNPSEKVPESFPVFAEIFFSDDQETFLSLGQQVYENELVTKSANYLAQSLFLSKSAFVFLSWTIIKEFIKKNRRDKNKFNSYAKAGLENSLYKDDKLGRRIAIWSNSVRMQSSALNSVGVKSLFFIQPNHHYKNSKPIAKKEPFVPDQVEFVSKSYNRLRKEADNLKKAGINVYSLIQVFKGEERVIYIDDCHVNDLGNLLMGMAIAKKLIERADYFFQGV